MSGDSARLRPEAAGRRWLACVGMLGVLCASAPARAQDDAKAALVEQGVYWQTMGRADMAEESWRKLLSVDPQSADAMYGMSQVELARGNAEAARGWISRLHAAHPGDPRGTRQAQQGATPQTDVQRARAAAKAGRTAEAVQLYRAIFGNQAPPEPLALEFYQLLGGTQQGWEEGRKGLEQRVKDKPDNLDDRLALAQLQTYREPSRREGIHSLAGLSDKAGVGSAARSSWRQALLWLDAREADASLYEDFLGKQADPAVQARLDALNAGRSVAATAAPAAQPLSEGFKALNHGDTATAEQRFQQALKVQPGDAEALGGLGLVRLRQKRFAEAQHLLEQASKDGGGAKWASALRSASYWNLVGQAHAARTQGDPRSAQTLLERAVKLDPRESVGQLALADLRSAGGGLQDVRAEAARARARSQIEAGDVAAARNTLEAALLATPDSPWIRLDLANLYRRQGMTAQAGGVMDGLLKSQPAMPDALYANALFAADAGDPAKGLQYLDRIPAASRTRDMTQLQRRLWAVGQTQQAQALARQGQGAAARNLLAQTEAALGSDMTVELWRQLAGAYVDIGDTPRALAMSREWLARSPDPGVGDRLAYASILLKTRQDVELSAVLQQLQDARMTSAQRADYGSLRIAFSLHQADALREAGNLEAACNAMAPVLAERPDDPQALAARARLYSAAHDEQQALLLYQRILQRDPTDIDTLIAAAASASALRADADADSYVQAALKQAPDASRVLAAAGHVYRNAGDTARAELYLRAAVAADSRAAANDPTPAAVNPLSNELQDLEAERSATLDVGSVFRLRDGEPGLSRLRDMELPIEARFPAGDGKILLTATPTVLDNGTLAPDYATASRFGAGPQAAYNLLAGKLPSQEAQKASGVGLSAGYEGKNLNANIGSTPLGFQQTHMIGNVTYNGAISDKVSFKADVSRRAVTDSLLSFAGAEDSRTGDRWGGVMATGARLEVTRDDGSHGLYGYGSGYAITGHNVANNTRYEIGGGMYVHLMSQPGSSLTWGMNLDLLGYDKNLSYFSYGQGGYFSPQNYVSVAFPLDWTGRDERLAWRLNASLGVQSFTQDASPYFPTDPARTAGAASAAAAATGLGIGKTPFTGFYPSTSHTGVAYNLAGILEYQLAPQLYLGGAMAFNNAQNYRQMVVSAYLRYMLGNAGRYASPTGGATLKPVSSPYTPLL